MPPTEMQLDGAADVDRRRTDALDAVVISTIEHLREAGVTTPMGVSQVLCRAAELLKRGKLPIASAISVPSEMPEPQGECPRCGAGALTFRADRRSSEGRASGVTRIFLACAQPGCGYAET